MAAGDSPSKGMSKYTRDRNNGKDASKRSELSSAFRTIDGNTLGEQLLA